MDEADCLHDPQTLFRNPSDKTMVFEVWVSVRLPVRVEITFCPRENHMIVSTLSECSQKGDHMFVHFAIESLEGFNLLFKLDTPVFLLEPFDSKEPTSDIDLEKLARG